MKPHTQMKIQNTLILGTLVMMCPLSLSATAPRVLFVTENTPAATALRAIVETEYNLPARIEWVAAGNVANQFQVVPFDSIPDAEQLLEQRLAQLGLQADDPADKGFTDFLTSLGYNVRRSETTREIDPFFQVEVVTHEFHGTVSSSISGSFKLSPEQVARLQEYDLIIMSRDTGTGFNYAWGGGSAMELHAQWTALTVPVISFSSSLIQTNEFGSFGWGWFYGFNAAHTVGMPYDRHTATPRFVVPDLTPVVTNMNSLLDGVAVVEGRADIYIDGEQNPVLPNALRKFSNNANFAYPPNATVILSFDYPNFVHASAGNITTRNPILARFTAGVRFF
ncbi:MAG: hypothetical protein LR015_01745 [Verrucomicrobia bacterium]|nr:hypothetical protein [Verrucomicrobiota bacterium]